MTFGFEVSEADGWDVVLDASTVIPGMDALPAKDFSQLAWIRSCSDRVRHPPPAHWPEALGPAIRE